ncbi:hypothetical protein [Pseudonocardia sp. GCM10023141]|uniref:hypothetical protein n=1 Tax=Pseudonocardia sp. GCM10023141 TaxID=3252653 RepID=UPI003611F8CC
MARWSVSVESEGDRVLGVDEVVGLADAVAPMGGIASGIGSTRYGAQLIVEAGDRDAALEQGRTAFRAAARAAGLPDGPVVRLDAVGEDEDGDA